MVNDKILKDDYNEKEEKYNKRLEVLQNVSIQDNIFLLKEMKTENLIRYCKMG